MKSAAIAFEDVSKSFDGGRVAALDRISLSVPDREFLVIVGPSGCGKTTLLRLVNRLIFQDEGVVRFQGADASRADPIELRRRIGYVFQGIGLFPHMTVAENIGITPRLLGWDTGKISRRVDELLELVRLSPEKYRNRFPRELSGGEQQRAGVARALGAGPGVVLMDEPFGALDPLTRDALGEDYRRLHDELGLTTLMITHDMLEAMLLADRIAVMQGGKLIEQGTPQSLIGGAKHPYVRELMQTPQRHAERLNRLMNKRPA